MASVFVWVFFFRTLFVNQTDGMLIIGRMWRRIRSWWKPSCRRRNKQFCLVVFVFLLLLIFWVKVEERRRSLKELEMNGRRNINIERYSRPNKSLVLKSYLAQPFVSLFPSLSLSVCFFMAYFTGWWWEHFCLLIIPPKNSFFVIFFLCGRTPFLFLFFCLHSSALAFSASLIPFVISHCHWTMRSGSSSSLSFRVFLFLCERKNSKFKKKKRAGNLPCHIPICCGGHWFRLAFQIRFLFSNYWLLISFPFPKVVKSIGHNTSCPDL